MKRALSVFFKSDAAVGVIISLLIAFLASTVKNPNSKRAGALRAGVAELRDGCDEFLAVVPAPGGAAETVWE